MKHILAKTNYFKKLTITSILTLFIAFFISCSKDEIETITISKSLDITIDNENFKITNSLISSNENCNGLFANCTYENSKDIGFRIEFSFNKSGALRNITLIDYGNKNTQFESADFNPKGLMSISNFEYDESKKYLHFDFKGELLQQAYSNELDTDKKRKHIEGTVNIKDVKNTECTSFTPQLNFETTNLKFLSNIYFGTYNPNLNINPYQNYLYSDNGYRTIFKSKVDLWNQEKGTYVFDQNSIENKIDFEQYTGIFRATQLFVRDTDWKKYQTNGSYTITDHQFINGQKVTKGEFNLQVFDNGILKYDIKNAKFEVVGF